MNARDVMNRLVALEERCAELEGKAQAMAEAMAAAEVVKEIDQRLQSVEDWRKNQDKKTWERGQNRR